MAFCQQKSTHRRDRDAARFQHLQTAGRFVFETGLTTRRLHAIRWHRCLAAHERAEFHWNPIKDAGHLAPAWIPKAEGGRSSLWRAVVKTMVEEIPGGCHRAAADGRNDVPPCHNAAQSKSHSGISFVGNYFRDNNGFPFFGASREVPSCRTEEGSLASGRASTSGRSTTSDTLRGYVLLDQQRLTMISPSLTSTSMR